MDAPRLSYQQFKFGPGELPPMIDRVVWEECTPGLPWTDRRSSAEPDHLPVYVRQRYQVQEEVPCSQSIFEARGVRLKGGLRRLGLGTWFAPWCGEWIRNETDPYEKWSSRRRFRRRSTEHATHNSF